MFSGKGVLLNENKSYILGDGSSKVGRFAIFNFSTPVSSYWYGVFQHHNLNEGTAVPSLNYQFTSLSPWFSMFCSFHDKARLHHSRRSRCIPNLTSGKLRLAKWFIPLTAKAKAKMVHEVTHLVMARRQRTLCNFLEFKGEKGSIFAIPSANAESCISF